MNTAKAPTLEYSPLTARDVLPSAMKRFTESRRMTILAVDDNRDNLVILRALIREALPEAEFIPASSGESGIALAATEDPDVILLDVVMPGMDGFDVCRKLKTDNTLKDIPVVFITAIKGDKESRIRALECGGEALLAKPVDEIELAAQIRAMAKIKTANVAKRNEQHRLAALVDIQVRELQLAHAATLKLLDDVRTEAEARRKSEEALRESQAFLNAALDNSQVGIAIADAPGGVLRYVNDAGLLIRGGDRKTVVNGVGIDRYVSSWQLMDFDGRPLEPDEVPLARAIRFGETCSREFLIRRVENDDRIILANASPIRDVSGKVVAGIVAFMDVTDRKRAEERLHDSERKLSILFEALTVGISVLDEYNRIVYLNPALSNILDISHGGLIRGDYRNRTYLRSDGTVMPPEEFASTVALREKRTVSNVEIGVIKEDGREVWVSTSAVPVAVSNWRVVTVTADITARKRVETLNAQLAAIVHSSGDAIVGKDLRGIITSWNAGAETLFGYPAEEIIGRSVTRLIPQDRLAEEETIMKLIIAGERVESFETKRLAKSGKVIDISVTISPIRDLSGKIAGASKVARDISERKVAEEQIAALLAEKELLLKEVHHRIKNNMTTMMGMLSLQADTMKDAGSIAALDNARRRMQSMMVLYDKLYRSEGFRCMSAKEYLVPLVHEIVENLPNHGGVVVETHVDDFILDAKHLSPVGIIVNELLTNIMKHAFAGREDGLVRVSASLKERRASIVVEDDGIGLPASFDFRTSSGFGMQVIEMLRVQIGGSLRIEHEKGTNVTLEFNV